MSAKMLWKAGGMATMPEVRSTECCAPKDAPPATYFQRELVRAWEAIGADRAAVYRASMQLCFFI